jgi:hypothetical protein
METWLAQALSWILGRPSQEGEPGCDDGELSSCCNAVEMQQFHIATA